MLGSLKPLLGEFGLALLAEGDSELEGCFRFGFGRAAFLDAALVVLVGDDEFAVGAFSDPIAKGGNVSIALRPDNLTADLDFLVFWRRGFGRTDDAALFVDPNSSGDVG